MSTPAAPAPPSSRAPFGGRAPSDGRAVRARARRKRADRIGDRLLYGICLAAALLAIAVMVLVIYQIVDGASPAISKYGLSFVTNSAWQPNFELFGAAPFLYGTLVTSFLALLLGAPIAISIGLYLSLLAPSGVRSIVSPLVETLAAIPSVILGFWGLLILAPFVHTHDRALPAQHASASSRSSAHPRRPARASSPRA